MKQTSRRVFENWKARYACQRASPMVCLNQALAAELNVLTRSRELEGLSMNALSYEKSVAV
jgi:DNA polymerase mu